MLSLNFSTIGSPIHLIVSLLINWIAMCIYSQLKYCFKSYLQIVSSGIHERKNIGPTFLKIYKHDNSGIKILIFVLDLR